MRESLNSRQYNFDNNAKLCSLYIDIFCLFCSQEPLFPPIFGGGFGFLNSVGKAPVFGEVLEGVENISSSKRALHIRLFRYK